MHACSCRAIPESSHAWTAAIEIPARWHHFGEGLRDPLLLTAQILRTRRGIQEAKSASTRHLAPSTVRTLRTVRTVRTLLVKAGFEIRQRFLDAMEEGGFKVGPVAKVA